MADKALRGTKRTCQSGSCGERFYDLNRDPIVCPICGHEYVIAHGPAEPAREEAARRPARKLEPAAAGPIAGDAPEVDADDALADVDVDVDGDDAIADGDDETFLEDEEDEGGDVTGIVGGPGGDDDES
ncbi:MAG: TIGR02300 family protein [Hyphomicrobiaceae bacterium]